jgi:hypothetical protein
MSAPGFFLVVARKSAGPPYPYARLAAVSCMRRASSRFLPVSVAAALTLAFAAPAGPGHPMSADPHDDHGHPPLGAGECRAHDCLLSFWFRPAGRRAGGLTSRPAAFSPDSCATDRKECGNAGFRRSCPLRHRVPDPRDVHLHQRGLLPGKPAAGRAGLPRLHLAGVGTKWSVPKRRRRR